MKVIKTDLFTERIPNAMTFINFFVMGLLITLWFSSNAISQVECESVSSDCRELIEPDSLKPGVIPDSLVFDFTRCDSKDGKAIGLPISLLKKSVKSQVALDLSEVPSFEPGFYDIWTTTKHSDDQKNESFYLEVGATGPCSTTNAGSYFVVQDKNDLECVRNYAGRFYLTRDDSIWFKHYYVIVEDSLVNRCLNDTLCFGKNESVQLFRMTLKKPDILTKKANKRKILPGETVEYTLMVSDAAQHTARNLKIKDILPEAVSLDSVWVQPEEFIYEFDSTGNELFFNFDLLSSGQSVSFIYRVKVADSFPSLPDTLENISVITSNCGDDTASVVVIVGNPRYDLKLTKTAVPDTVFGAQPFKYSLEIVNFGPDTARSFEVWDDFENSVVLSGFTVAPEDPSAPDILHWKITERLAPGDSTCIEYMGVCPSGIEQPLQIINTAKVISTFDTDSTNNVDSASVVCERVTKGKAFLLDRSVFEPERQDDDLGIIVKVDSETDITLQIVDITGYIVRRFPQATVNRRQEFTWDGKTDTNQRAASGVYLIICRGKTPNGKTTEDIQKVIVVR